MQTSEKKYCLWGMKSLHLSKHVTLIRHHEEMSLNMLNDCMGVLPHVGFLPQFTWCMGEHVSESFTFQLRRCLLPKYHLLAYKLQQIGWVWAPMYIIRHRIELRLRCYLDWRQGCRKSSTVYTCTCESHTEADICKEHFVLIWICHCIQAYGHCFCFQRRQALTCFTT